MSEPHWTSYVGMVTGTFGAVMGFLGFRRANQIKVLDLRLELNRLWNETELSVDGLETYLDFVNESHQRVMAMRGLNRSGAWESWKAEFGTDKATVNALLERAPKREASYENMKVHDLEEKLVELHKFKGQLDQIRQKYQGVLQSDEEHRRDRRQEVASRVPPVVSRDS